jgi:hypothetical protein
MNLLSYIKELLLLNRSRLRYFTDCPHFAHMLFGLCEELLELHQKLDRFKKAKNKTPELWHAVVLELGDVLAYTVLASSAIRLDPMMSLDEIVYDLEACLSPLFVLNKKEKANLIELALSLAGKSKRWYREASPVSVRDFAEAFVKAFSHVRSVKEELSFEQVAEANITKLQTRSANNTLFQGQGDTR